jgi:hypothetical protein
MRISMSYADQPQPGKTPEKGPRNDLPLKRLDRVRSVIRTLPYRIRAEDADVPWSKRFILVWLIQASLRCGLPCRGKN